MMLKMEKVGFKYEKANKSVLKNVTANFEQGKLYVIMGKSGAGKSTLLALLSGLDVCKSGVISYQDKNLSEMNRNTYRAQNIGVVFQSYNLLTNATAIDNVVLPIDISGKNIKSKNTAYDILGSMGINKQMANRKVLKLSGGEQQRVAIASAIAHNPEIIIADEPTGNLDDDTEIEIMNILLRLAHEENKCVIIVTHSKDVAGYADELWGLAKGNLNYIKNRKN
jgi:ABC-type antimicrobial peptide transport system, ATPase component